MKVLISAEGTSRESKVSKRFGHAPHYVIVDTEAPDIRLLEGTGTMTKQDIIRKAAHEGVEAVITGHLGPHASAAIRANELVAVLAHDMTLGRAVEAYQHGELKTLDSSALEHSMEDHERRRMESRQQRGNRPLGYSNTVGFRSGTARGRHHLQQFAGRGH
jgi:predicted Fe-Mo cluster-binding NifX family protein